MRRSSGQEELLRASRIHRNPRMGEIIENAAADDLKWFVQILEFQLEETPHWVTDKDQLEEMQAWTRRVRTMATEALHGKEITARRWARVWSFCERIVLIIFGLLLGALIRLYTQG